jgi:hypothetical protein
MMDISIPTYVGRVPHIITDNATKRPAGIHSGLVQHERIHGTPECGQFFRSVEPSSSVSPKFYASFFCMDDRACVHGTDDRACVHGTDGQFWLEPGDWVGMGKSEASASSCFRSKKAMR